MTNGGWQLTDGRWRREKSKCRLDSNQLDSTRLDLNLILRGWKEMQVSSVEKVDATHTPYGVERERKDASAPVRVTWASHGDGETRKREGRKMMISGDTRTETNQEAGRMTTGFTS